MGSTGPGQHKMPEPEKASLNERMCLRAKKGSQEKLCLIRSKLALTLLTRLVFLVLTLSCTAVITTSIWLMMNCRESFATVRPVMPEHALFCTNMGMPALFACCTILFTVFGLGCTGRRLTGYALIIISSVEILQSVTTLAFYKCNTISHHDILDTVNSSLLGCQRPVGLNHPLFMTAETAIKTRTPAGGPRRVKRGLKMAGKVDHGYRFETRGPGRSQQEGILAATFERNDALKLVQKRHIDQFNNKMRVTSHSAPERKTIKPFNPDRSRHLDISKGDVQCVMNSPFFTQLSLKLRPTEVHECLDVCLTYLAVCFNPVWAELGPQDGIPSTTPIFQGPQVSAASPQPAYNVRPTPRSRHTFDEDVLECGHMVLRHVNNLCFYNDEVILPLSICAPVFYILLSLGFIYLCHCDRRLKESPTPEIKVPSHTADIPRQWTWRRLPFFSGQDYGSGVTSCQCGVGGKGASGTPGLGLGRTPHGTYSSVTLNSECSSSTHELLQMKTLPAAETSHGLDLTHGASRDTLDTLLSDDQSPAAKP